MRNDANHEQDQGDKKADTGRQTVETVDEVECIGHQNEPEYRTRQGKNTEFQPVAEAGHGDDFDPETAMIGDQSGCNLYQ